MPRIEIGSASKTFHKWGESMEIEPNDTRVIFDFKKKEDDAIIVAHDGNSDLVHVARTEANNIASIHFDPDTGRCDVRFIDPQKIRPVAILHGNNMGFSSVSDEHGTLPISVIKGRESCIQYARLDRKGPILPIRINH